MRFFIAIPLPDDIRKRLISVQKPADGIRWQSEEQMHMTLKFVGDLDGERADKLSEDLKKVPMNRFGLLLTGPGKFPERGSPRVLWVGVSLPEELKTLQKKISRIAEEAGAEKSRHRYIPHITLARIKSEIDKPVKSLIQSSREVTDIPFVADRFILYKSELNSDGAIHRPVTEVSV